jgi:hypothetical protein
MLFVPLPLGFSLLFHVFQHNICHGWAIPLINNLDTKTQYVGEYTLPWPPHTHVDGLMGDVMITHQLHKHCFWCKGLLLLKPFLSFLCFSRFGLSPFFPLILVHWYVIRSESPKTLMWDYLSILFQLAKIVISSALNGLLTVLGNWMCRIHLRHRNNHVRLKIILLLAKLWLEFIVLGPNQVGAIQPSSLKFLSEGIETV